MFEVKPHHLYQNKREDLIWYLEEGLRSDLKVYFREQRKFDKGWKLSIQGCSVEDSIFFIDHLYSWFQDEHISSKIATTKRYKLKERKENVQYYTEQSHKALTIYCPNDMDVIELGNIIYEKLSAAGYTGWDDVPAPSGYTLIKGGVYFRNDRNENGEYIKAIDAKH